MKSMFMIRAYQFGIPASPWFLHEDLSQFLRYLKGILEVAKFNKFITRFFLSSRGCTLFWPSEKDQNEVQLQIIEPYAQIMIHFEKEEDLQDPTVWERIRAVNSSKKTKKKNKVKYFDYKVKSFFFTDKPNAPRLINFRNRGGSKRSSSSGRAPHPAEAAKKAMRPGKGSGGRGGKGSGGRGGRF